MAEVKNKVNNKNLCSAKYNKRDEFYTQLVDIEKELVYYKDLDHFKNKTVYCNCDNPKTSKFFQYFSNSFETLGLKKLITTCYNDNMQSREKDSNQAFYLEYGGKESKLNIRPLKGNGDFRSDECISFLKQADVVVSNPPFSLFREYLNLLVDHDKKFLIIGNVNAITYKETFRLIKEGKMWLGASIHSGGIEFGVPSDYLVHSSSCRIDENGNKFVRVPGIRWFTNMNYEGQNRKLDIFKQYNTKDYPTYDNYEAINVNKTKDIPIDYNGVMGVPITFLDKFNPNQFEILGLSASAGYDANIVGIPFLGKKDARPLLNNKNTYARIFIRHRNPL